jgi:hypothetical protein
LPVWPRLARVITASVLTEPARFHISITRARIRRSAVADADILRGPTGPRTRQSRLAGRHLR